jgi:hypothetical protein
MEILNYIGHSVCVVDEKGELIKKFMEHDNWLDNYKAAQEWVDEQ